MIITVDRPVNIDVKKMRIHMKVGDEFKCKILDNEDNSIMKYKGYVPNIMPNVFDGDSHFGDYLCLDIDIETGQILNWKKPTMEQLTQFINNDEE
jgi:hypothetical protein